MFCLQGTRCSNYMPCLSGFICFFVFSPVAFFSVINPLPEGQSRIEPATLHHTGQRAQHTTNWAIPAPSKPHQKIASMATGKASTSRPRDPEFEPRFRASSHTNDLQNVTQVATLPGAWRCKVNARTGRPGVSELWLSEVTSLICNFCRRVTAHKIV